MLMVVEIFMMAMILCCDNVYSCYSVYCYDNVHDCGCI